MTVDCGSSLFDAEILLVIQGLYQKFLAKSVNFTLSEKILPLTDQWSLLIQLNSYIHQRDRLFV
ncbi:hypothetical protein H6G33_20915 [Calothrix sp. FACHB-1219]|uniref:hypothetical protein n=1 Tax=unclassified Calothrix TaxID=2619626 RepID=UPI0016853D60|nr:MULTISPECIES: hypothetical protein [unclassified Calothrix]MBD2219480.1 hypothetical protein [Calothrix sp. FACHB-1219]